MPNWILLASGGWHLHGAPLWFFGFAVFCEFVEVLSEGQDKRFFFWQNHFQGLGLPSVSQAYTLEPLLYSTSYKNLGFLSTKRCGPDKVSREGPLGYVRTRAEEDFRLPVTFPHGELFSPNQPTHTHTHTRAPCQYS